MYFTLIPGNSTWNNGYTAYIICNILHMYLQWGSYCCYQEGTQTILFPQSHCQEWSHANKVSQGKIHRNRTLITSRMLLPLSHWTHDREVEANLLMTAVPEASADSSCLATISREIIEPEVGRVGSESICPGYVFVNPPQAHNPICWGFPFKNTAVYPTVGERRLKLAEVSSMAVISRLAYAPLLWVQWLSGKNVIGRSLHGLNPSWIPMDFTLQTIL